MTIACEPTISTTKSSSTAQWVAPALLIFILAAVCFTVHLGAGPLAGTEGHRAITAHQMLRDGDYLIPRLYGAVYLAKPPLPYWLIALSERLFGANEFAWRLPSAIGTALLAAGICAMAARWFDKSAGIAAGLAFIAIIPLWSQQRSADVDALNHLGCILAALAIIEIGLRSAHRPSFWLVLLATVGIVLSLLSKGPAGLPVILGAVIGPAIANRSLGPFKSKWIYAALIAGALPLAIWALLVVRRTTTPFSGANQAEELLIISSANHLFYVLTLPLVILAYGFPVSVSILLPMSARFRRAFLPRQQALLKALLGTILAAFAIQICSGMTNPRYAYLDLPILAPIVGALIMGWRRQFWPQRGRQDALFWSGVVVVCYGITAIVFLLIRRQSAVSLTGLALWIAIAGIVLLLIVGLIALFRDFLRVAAGVAGIMVVLAALAFGFYKSAEQFERSARSASAPLAKIVPKNARLLSWDAMWSQPELFFYAHLHPTIIHLMSPDNLPNNSWLAMDHDEWVGWKNKPGAMSRLSQVHVLHPYKHRVYVCYLSGTSEIGRSLSAISIMKHQQ